MISDPSTDADDLQNQFKNLLYINLELLGVTPPSNTEAIKRCRRQIKCLYAIKPARQEALLNSFDLTQNYFFMGEDTTAHPLLAP